VPGVVTPPRAPGPPGGGGARPLLVLDVWGIVILLLILININK
jgi:hypothetical protein